MKTYTGEQYLRRLVIAGLAAFMHVIGVVVLARHGEHLPGGEWIPILSCVLMAIMGALLWKWTSNILPLRGSFLIDQHDRVVAYVHNELFVNAKQLGQKKWRVVRHALEDIVVDGAHQILVAGREKEMTVSVTVWVDVDPARLQDYFDTFLKSDGLPTPEDLISELIDGCEFFRRQELVACRADSSDCAATIVGKQLAERLKKWLQSSGLRVKLVACVATD